MIFFFRESLALINTSYQFLTDSSIMTNLPGLSMAHLKLQKPNITTPIQLSLRLTRRCKRMYMKKKPVFMFQHNEMTLSVAEILFANGQARFSNVLLAPIVPIIRCFWFQVLNETQSTELTTEILHRNFLNRTFETGIRATHIGSNSMRSRDSVFYRLNMSTQKFEVFGCISQCGGDLRVSLPLIIISPLGPLTLVRRTSANCQQLRTHGRNTLQCHLMNRNADFVMTNVTITVNRNRNPCFDIKDLGRFLADTIVVIIGSCIGAALLCCLGSLMTYCYMCALSNQLQTISKP